LFEVSYRNFGMNQVENRTMNLMKRGKKL
jgi:hypothetical protein